LSEKRPASQDTKLILVVDDDVDHLEITRINLEAADPNLSITSVTSPEDGLELLDKQHYDCIVSDYKMPRMDGIKFARRIRETSGIPFILYTGQGSEEVAEEAFTVGVDDYIRKEAHSSHIQVLAKRIRSAIDQKNATDEQKRYRERLEAIHRHASELGKTRDAKEVAKYTLDGIDDIFGFQKMSFSMVDGHIIRPVEIRSDSPLSRTEIPLDDVGLIAEVVRTGESILVPNVRIIENYYMARESTMSELTVPVMIDDEVVAVINIESSEVDAFSIEDQRLVETFSEHVASAISINRETNKLRLSEEEYRSLFESTRNGVLISGPDGRYTSANNSAAAILGYDSPEDLVGLSAVDFYANPEERDEVYRTLMETGYLTDYEHEIKRKDGSLGTVSANVTLHKDDDGEILRSEVFFRDITERKRIENQLRESETLYRDLAEKSLDVIYRVDLEGRLQYISQAIGPVAGYRPEEVIGESFIGFLPEDERLKVSEAIQNALKGNQVQLFETEILDKEGSRVSVAVNSSPLMRDGEIIGFQGIIRDISEHSRMIEELRLSEERFRNLVELSPEVIITFDFKGFVTSVNSAIERLSGFSPDEIVGSHFTKLGIVRLQDIPRFVGIFSSVIKGKMPPPFEFPYKHKDGTLKWAQGRGAYVHEKSKRVGFQVVVMDITDRRRMEEELREHSKDLESRVEQRTRELLDAERMVAAGRVASTLGHDLRGPLVTISNAVEMAMKHPEEADRYLAMIRRNSHRSIELIEGLREELREKPLRREMIDLGNMIQRAIVETVIPDSVKTGLLVDDNLGSVMIDASQIRRVLDNLVSNSLEAMPNGGELTISASRDDEMVHIEVSDTGTGITKEDMKSLFTPFHSKKSGGVGMGLVSCKQTVEAHGGSIQVESKVGKGTTVVIAIPSDAEN